MCNGNRVMQAPTYSNKLVRNNFPTPTKSSSHDGSSQPQKFRHTLEPYSVDLGVKLQKARCVAE